MFVKFWCGCGIGVVLDFGPIRRCKPFVVIILGVFGYGVLEALQGFADKVGHGDVNLVFWIVPIDGQSVVIASRWVDGYGVMLSECIDEVDSVGGGK